MSAESTESVVSRRLHISGLSGSITETDLTRRFASFGRVVAVDGFGQLDGVGRPRKFAYLTLEATPSKLAKCVAGLSGSTWKGAKLRIGDAKPDYQQRIQSERETSPPPRKRLRKDKYLSRHAEDMRLVTPEIARTKPGWKVTEAGRIIRPIRMRPVRPLPPLPGVNEGKKKTRLRPSPTRARRRKIDGTLWGSTHATGSFMDFVADPQPQTTSVPSPKALPIQKPVATHVPDPKPPSKSAPLTSKNLAGEVPSSNEPSLSLEQEAKDSLALLHSLFGTSTDDGDDWVGRATPPTDVEMDVLSTNPSPEETDAGEEREESVELEVAPKPPATKSPPPPPAEESAPTLKALFAPAAEQSFSFVDQLDADLDLDEEIPYAINPEPSSVGYLGQRVESLPLSVLSGKQHRRVLDPKASMFFQPPLTKAGQRTDWRTSGFHRTQTSDEIHAEWDETKGELTRTWKKRSKEASKLRKRRGGGTGD